MDLGSISTAVGTLKTVGEMAKGLLHLHTLAEVQAKAIELNTKIIDAQYQIFEANAAQTTLVERVKELETQITRMKDWDNQKRRYKLAAPFPGCMVFALLKSESETETAHYLCATCFKKGEPSILQGKESRGSLAYYFCYSCKSQAETRWSNVQPPRYFEDISPET